MLDTDAVLRMLRALASQDNSVVANIAEAPSMDNCGMPIELMLNILEG
jgi:hypothetical protein